MGTSTGAKWLLKGYWRINFLKDLDLIRWLAVNLESILTAELCIFKLYPVGWCVELVEPANVPPQIRRFPRILIGSLASKHHWAHINAKARNRSKQFENDDHIRS